ncbi:hypothetical protein M441DRAFT_351340 [Trichoderma asperellum CBS 433.97]|uniref:Uncharacterized protein n=1 Tax=Trichoderma asperellum (strain ATCC 204424 / CBS 433.97 / NBRC 101777) TaxID=1042311 RepID=A0A2T3ZIC7_TRIA4|nr:hypothetical protein M441DRAFT_351340 [Trichoderma asperellum CBS 433.97]PTB44564.1 hypothetical protein M441DRAFT_351340 [Trichoderma asperellum CBS 433.97]
MFVLYNVVISTTKYSEKNLNLRCCHVEFIFFFGAICYGSRLLLYCVLLWG